MAACIVSSIQFGICMFIHYWIYDSCKRTRNHNILHCAIVGAVLSAHLWLFFLCLSCISSADSVDLDSYSIGKHNWAKWIWMVSFLIIQLKNRRFAMHWTCAASSLSLSHTHICFIFFCEHCYLFSFIFVHIKMYPYLYPCSGNDCSYMSLSCRHTEPESEYILLANVLFNLRKNEIFARRRSRTTENCDAWFFGALSEKIHIEWSLKTHSTPRHKPYASNATISRYRTSFLWAKPLQILWLTLRPNRIQCTHTELNHRKCLLSRHTHTHTYGKKAFLLDHCTHTFHSVSLFFLFHFGFSIKINLATKSR